MKFCIFLTLIAVAAANPLLRLRRQAGEDTKSEGSSEYHHEVQHDFAKSHQSIKFHHFHPVPVYVKKEYIHLLKDPLEKGKTSHGVKLLHPKTEHNHGYGLILESHSYDHGIHGKSEDSGFEHVPQMEQKLESGSEGGWEGYEQAPIHENQELGEQEQHEYPGFAGYYEYKGEEASESH